MPGGAGAAQPPELSTTGVQAWGVPRHCPGEAARPEGHRGGQAGSGPPLQTLTLFSQVRRQFPWKQPGAETGTRIQKCEALSSSSPSWIPAPHDPSWVLAPTLLPPCVGVQGCPAWAPGLGCSCPCTLQHPWAWCVGMGMVSQQGCAGGSVGMGHCRQGRGCQGMLLAAACTDQFKQHLHTSVGQGAAQGWARCSCMQVCFIGVMGV